MSRADAPADGPAAWRMQAMAARCTRARPMPSLCDSWRTGRPGRACSRYGLAYDLFRQPACVRPPAHPLRRGSAPQCTRPSPALRGFRGRTPLPRSERCRTGTDTATASGKPAAGLQRVRSGDMAWRSWRRFAGCVSPARLSLRQQAVTRDDQAAKSASASGSQRSSRPVSRSVCSHAVSRNQVWSRRRAGVPGSGGHERGKQWPDSSVPWVALLI